jgi:hypothetical protein
VTLVIIGEDFGRGSFLFQISHVAASCHFSLKSGGVIVRSFGLNQATLSTYLKEIAPLSFGGIWTLIWPIMMDG